MSSYESPLHTVSAQISELGMTFAQKSVDGKSNEIPAVQELIEQLEISGCIVVADVLNCRKKTAKAIIAGSADYLLCAKDNQANVPFRRSCLIVCLSLPAHAILLKDWKKISQQWKCIWQP